MLLLNTLKSKARLAHCIVVFSCTVTGCKAEMPDPTATIDEGARPSFDFRPVADPAEARGDAFPMAVFIEGETDYPPVVHIAVTPALPEGTPLTARCYNFWDEEVGSVEVRAAGEGRYSLHPDVEDIGWYRLELAADEWVQLRRIPGDERSLETYPFLPFAIVPFPHSEDTYPHTPFGIDTGPGLGATWMPPADWLAEMSWLTGCRWVRDRMIWTKTNPARDTFVWESVEPSARLFGEYGMRVLQLFARPVPKWIQPEGGSMSSYPEDLRDAYNYAYQATFVLAPDVQAFEIWNEHDIGHYADEPPDAFAAVTKAMALGIHAACVDMGMGEERTLALLGPFARHPEVGGYARTLGANEISPYLDAYSFHTYQPVGDAMFGRVLDTHLQVSRELGFPPPTATDYTVWLTETGKPYGRNEIPEPRKAMEQQLTYLFESYMKSLSKGVSPVFTFWLTPYYGSRFSKPEDRILLQFGITDSNWAPLPTYAALATMAYELGEARLINQFAEGENRIYIFDTDGEGEQLVAFVLPPAQSAGSETPLRLHGLEADCEVIDAMGTPLSVLKDAEGFIVESHGFPVYVKNPPLAWLYAEGSESGDKAITSADESDEAASDGDINLDVVLRVVYPRGYIDKDARRVESNWDGLNSNWTPRGYLYTPGETIEASMDVYNFSKETQAGSLTPDFPPGYKVAMDSETVTVPSMGRVTVKLAITTPPTPPDADEETAPLWVMRGQFSGRTVTPSASQWHARPAPQASLARPPIRQKAYVFALADELEPTRSVSYKQEQDGRGLRLHLFEPDDSTMTGLRPCLVVFHGGGWTGGSPRMVYPFAQWAASQGMVGISVEYRLSQMQPDEAPTVFDSVADARSAMRYVLSHADELGVDPDRVVVCGASAGGHLAVATTMFPQINAPGDDLGVSPAPAAMILLSPVLDTSAKGYGTAKIGERWAELSPLEQVKGDLPPTVIFHGTGDSVTPFSGAQAFQFAMLEAGNDCELVAVEKGIHTYMFKDENRYRETLVRMEGFLRNHGLLP